MKIHKQALDEWCRGADKEFPSPPYYKIFKAKVGPLNNLEEMLVYPVNRYQSDGTTVVPTSRGHFYFSDDEKDGQSLNGVAISLLTRARPN